MPKQKQKLHQIYSGTVKLEDGSSIIIDTTKAEYIKERFKGQTIGIFYKYKEEYNLIKQINTESVREVQDSIDQLVDEFSGLENFAKDRFPVLQDYINKVNAELKNIDKVEW